MNALPSANAGVDMHIYANGSASRNCKELRAHAKMFVRAILHIQDVVTGRQLSMIIAIRVHC
jgi:hypothetical protein